MIHVMADAATGRVGAVSTGFCLGDGELLLEAPAEFEMDRHMDWRVQDGALVHDPLPEPVPDDSPTLDDVIEYMTDIDLRLTMQEMGLG